VYFAVQRIAAAVRDAARFHAAPAELRGDEAAAARTQAFFVALLEDALAELPADAVPEILRGALESGAAVGPEADRWLPLVVEWLAQECARSSP
jgi:hypothetical protein